MSTVPAKTTAPADRSRWTIRRASVLLIPLAVAPGASARSAAASTAPAKAVRVAVAKARAQFYTRHVHADFSLLSRRDRRWALVDGFATARNRLWAAWLHDNRSGAWDLRYFDITAPFRPQSTNHGRVPCDLYPAFSEARCPPSGPSAAQIRAQMFKQLTPTGSAASIGTLIRNGGYTFTFKPPVNGSLMIAWYTASTNTHTLVARGNADFFNGRRGRITIKLTTAGKRILRAARTLKLTAKATFTPILYAAVSASRTFTLTR